MDEVEVQVLPEGFPLEYQTRVVVQRLEVNPTQSPLRTWPRQWPLRLHGQ